MLPTDIQMHEVGGDTYIVKSDLLAYLSQQHPDQTRSELLETEEAFAQEHHLGKADIIFIPGIEEEVIVRKVPTPLPDNLGDIITDVSTKYRVNDYSEPTHIIRDIRRMLQNTQLAEILGAYDSQDAANIIRDQLILDGWKVLDDWNATKPMPVDEQAIVELLTDNYGGLGLYRASELRQEAIRRSISSGYRESAVHKDHPFHAILDQHLAEAGLTLTEGHYYRDPEIADEEGYHADIAHVIATQGTPIRNGKLCIKSKLLAEVVKQHLANHKYIEDLSIDRINGAINEHTGNWSSAAPKARWARIIYSELSKADYETKPTELWLGNDHGGYNLIFPQSVVRQDFSNQLHQLRIAGVKSAAPIWIPAVNLTTAGNGETIVYAMLAGSIQMLQAAKANIQLAKDKQHRMDYNTGNVRFPDSSNLTFTYERAVDISPTYYVLHILHKFAQPTYLQENETPFAFMLRDTTRDHDPDQFIDLLNTVIALPVLPEWSEVLWDLGRGAKLIKTAGITVGHITAYEISRNNEAWADVISTAIKSGAISIGTTHETTRTSESRVLPDTNDTTNDDSDMDSTEREAQYATA